MTILEDLMYKEYIALEKSGTVEDAIKLMDQNHQGVVVIVENNIPFGVLTERNILEIINQNIDRSNLVADTFNFKAPITINKKRSVDYALHILIDNGIRRLVVVDDNGLFKGIATQDVLVRILEANSFKTDILVSQILDSNKKLISLNQNDTIVNAFKTMSLHKIGSVIALTDKGEAVGILTEKDAVIIANKKVSTDLPISSFMSSPLITAKENTPLQTIIEILTKNKINRLVITDKDTNKPINIISMRDIAQNLKGNYGQLLENKLKSIKNTLNFIDEYVLEIYEDNNEQIIQWMNKKAIEKFGNFLDKNITDLIGNSNWKDIYNIICKDRKIKKDTIQIQDMHFTMNCSYHYINKNETLLLVLQDITELANVIIDEKTKNQKLSHELEIVKSVMDQQNNIIFITDGKTISLSNKAFLNFFNIKHISEFSNKHNHIENTFIAHQGFFSRKNNEISWIEEINNSLEKEKIVSMIDYSSFEPKVFNVQITALPENESNFIITFIDITEEKLESQKYYFNATHDPLTKVYNKSFFLDSLNIALGKTKRYNSIVSLVFFNIDNLKLVNETYGFLHGDTVLTKIAKTVDKHIRNCDVLARYTGDIFVIMLPETNKHKAELLAENIKNIVAKLEFEDISNQTISLGVTQFSEIDNSNTLIQRAMDALLTAKENGKNKVVSL